MNFVPISVMDTMYVLIFYRNWVRKMPLPPPHWWDLSYYQKVPTNMKRGKLAGIQKFDSVDCQTSPLNFLEPKMMMMVDQLDHQFRLCVAVKNQGGGKTKRKLRNFKSSSLTIILFHRFQRQNSSADKYYSSMSSFLILSLLQKWNTDVSSELFFFLTSRDVDRYRLLDSTVCLCGDRDRYFYTEHTLLVGICK